MKYKYLIILNISFCFSLFSQPIYTYPSIMNCYQIFQLSNDTINPIKLINAGDNKFKIFGVSDDTTYYRIQQHSTNKYGRQVIYPINRLQDRKTFKLWDPIRKTYNMEVWKFENEGLGDKEIDLDDYEDSFDYSKPFYIDLIVKHKHPVTNQWYYSYDIQFKAQFVQPEDIFEFAPPIQDSCFTFDNFKMRFNPKINGLCKEPIIHLIYPTGIGVNTIDSIRIFEYQYVPPPAIGGPSYFVQTYPQNYCQDILTSTLPYPQNYPNRIPAGCMTFNIRIRLRPCDIPFNVTYPNCPDLIINKPIEICCSCDIRTPNPNN
jgi:hypothetical protein